MYTQLPYKRVILYTVFVGTAALLMWILSGCELSKAAKNIFDNSEESSTLQYKNETLSYNRSPTGVLFSESNTQTFFASVFNIPSPFLVSKYYESGCNDNTIFTLANGQPTSYPFSTQLASYSQLYTPIAIRINGNYLQLTTSGMANHPTSYYLNNEIPLPCSSGHGDGIAIGYSQTLHIPLTAIVTQKQSITDGSIIGIALNGALFVEDATVSTTLLDQKGGKPQPNGAYSYYSNKSFANSHHIIGFALDGFPILGSYDEKSTSENKQLPANLDTCRGHVGPLFEGTTRAGTYYHYHIPPDSSYDAVFLNCFSGKIP